LAEGEFGIADHGGGDVEGTGRLVLRTWGGTGLLVGTCRRDGGDEKRGFGVDMVRRPSLGMVTLDGHEIFSIVLENLGYNLENLGSVPNFQKHGRPKFP
jgi:hypothetical protein